MSTLRPSPSLEGPQAAAAVDAQTSQTSLVSEARSLVGDCFAHRSGLYWADLIATLAVSYTCAGIYLFAPQLGAGSLLAFAVAGFGLFRAGTFIHEIQHMGRGRMLGFKIAWNLVCGIPLLMPSYLYESHLDHHSVRHYGTSRDAEYLPLARGPAWRIVLYLLEVPLLPLLAVARFGLLAPLSLLVPPLRRWVLERASSYGIDLRYRRVLRGAEDRRLWALVDLAGFGWVIGCGLALAGGVLPLSWLYRVYVLALLTLGLNWVRTLAAHRYRSAGSRMSLREQLLDTLTVCGSSPLTWLLFPVGLRYHTLHHLLPSIPYHALGRAHRRLCAALPESSVYRQTLCPSFRSALRTLIRDARTAGAEARPAAS
ncbi:MAG: fatty acid desaturase family protein [Myxococcota bacterium]